MFENAWKRDNSCKNFPFGPIHISVYNVHPVCTMYYIYLPTTTYIGTKTISDFTKTPQFDIGNLTQLKDTQEDATGRPHFLQNILMIETLRLLNRIMKIMIRMSGVEYTRCSKIGKKVQFEIFFSKIS